MVQSCVVVGCTKRWSKGDRVSWHRFPPEHQTERRKLWINAVNRKNWIPKSVDRVCGCHFISGCAKSDPQSPDYVPSVNMGYKNVNSSTPVSKAGRYDRIKNRQDAKKRQQVDKEEMMIAASTLLDMSSSFNYGLDSDADDENSPPKPLQSRGLHDRCNEEIERLKVQNRQLVQELSRLQSVNQALEKEKADAFDSFGLEYMKSGQSDVKTSFYTGLPNFATLLWMINFIAPHMPAFKAIDCGHALLLVLMKLRLNLQNYDLAYRFHISPTTVSDVLNRSIPVIANQLKFLVHWPEKDDVVRTLPKIFRQCKPYRNARAIIDCTEIFVDRPGNFTARAATWSNYKHHNTLKYLISITPCGAVSFVSKAFGGRTSDKIVTQRSGFLDMLEFNDLILADRGFLIEEDIVARNCYLVMPSFTKGKTQLSQRQVETSRQLSRVRIHVERAIERIKNFKVLCSSVPLCFVPHIDSILTICAAVSNLQPPLVK